MAKSYIDTLSFESKTTYLTHRERQIADICDSSLYLEGSDKIFVLVPS